MSNPVAASRLSFDENLNILFEEIVLARKWNRPSILLAVHKSRFGQQRAEKELEERLKKIELVVSHLTVDSEHSDIPHILATAADPNQKVFFVSNLGWGGGPDRMDAYRALNIYRELFVDHRLRMVLWLTVGEAATLARFAPDFWSFRHRVVEFTGQRIPRQVKLPAGVLLWDVQNSVDPFEPFEARIAVREDLLRRLPDNTEARSSRIDLLYNLGYLYWASGDAGNASRRLNAALELAVGAYGEAARSSVLNGLAILCYEAKDFTGAADLLQQALQIQPDGASLLINMSATSNALGRNQEAATFANRAVKQQPRDGRVWNAQGYIHAALGKFDESIASFTRAVELSPRAVFSHAALAIMYDLVERADDSARALELARTLAHGPVQVFLDIYESALAGNAGELFEMAKTAASSHAIRLVELRRDPNLNLLIDAAHSEDDALSNST